MSRRGASGEKAQRRDAIGEMGILGLCLVPADATRNSVASDLPSRRVVLFLRNLAGANDLSE